MPLTAGSLRQAKTAPDGATLLRWAEQIAHALQRLPGPSGLDPDTVLLSGSEAGDVRLIPRRAPGRDRLFFAPEQRRPQGAAGPAADIYRLGLILYWLAQGDDSLPSSPTGGLTPPERNRFRRALVRLFGGDPDGTLCISTGRSLPDIDYNAARLVAWLERLLEPLPSARPTAIEVETAFREIRAALQPRIDSLKVCVTPAEIATGETARLELTATGAGLPAHGRWLNPTLDGKPLPLEPELPNGDYVSGTGVWCYHWTAGTGDLGQRRLEARCWVADRSLQGEALLRVVTPPVIPPQPVAPARDTIVPAPGPPQQRDRPPSAKVAGYVKDLHGKKLSGCVPRTGELTLGRDPDAGLVLPGDAISGKHVRLGWDPGTGGFWIEDLGSTNGTWWGKGDRLKAGCRYPLEPGRAFYLADRRTALAVFPHSEPPEDCKVR